MTFCLYAKQPRSLAFMSTQMLQLCDCETETFQYENQRQSSLKILVCHLNTLSCVHLFAIA